MAALSKKDLINLGALADRQQCMENAWGQDAYYGVHSLLLKGVFGDNYLDKLEPFIIKRGEYYTPGSRSKEMVFNNQKIWALLEETLGTSRGVEREISKADSAQRDKLGLIYSRSSIHSALDEICGWNFVAYQKDVIGNHFTGKRPEGCHRLSTNFGTLKRAEKAKLFPEGTVEVDMRCSFPQGIVFDAFNRGLIGRAEAKRCFETLEDLRLALGGKAESLEYFGINLKYNVSDVKLDELKVLLKDLGQWEWLPEWFAMTNKGPMKLKDLQQSVCEEYEFNIINKTLKNLAQQGIKAAYDFDGICVSVLDQGRAAKTMAAEYVEMLPFECDIKWALNHLIKLKVMDGEEEPNNELEKEQQSSLIHNVSDSFFFTPITQVFDELDNELAEARVKPPPDSQPLLARPGPDDWFLV